MENVFHQRPSLTSNEKRLNEPDEERLDDDGSGLFVVGELRLDL